MLRAGADKVAVNTAAVSDPGLIDRCAAAFGRQCVVLAVDARSSAPGRWEVVVNGGRAPTGRDAIDWIAEGVERGPVRSCSPRSTGTAPTTATTWTCSPPTAVSEVPVIASGGAGDPGHFVDAVTGGGASAVLAASTLHRRTLTINQIKRALAAAGIPVREAA